MRKTDKTIARSANVKKEEEEEDEEEEVKKNNVGNCALCDFLLILFHSLCVCVLNPS